MALFLQFGELTFEPSDALLGPFDGMEGSSQPSYPAGQGGSFLGYAGPELLKPEQARGASPERAAPGGGVGKGHHEPWVIDLQE
jgi:hypothetical protein